jgi:hypothetical protein
MKIKKIKIKEHQVIPRVTDIKKTLNFDVEKFILYLCSLKTFKKLGVNLDTGIKIICCGVYKNNKLRKITIRKTKNKHITGNARIGTPQNPGCMTISIGQECDIYDLIEMIIHEYIHCIGISHGDEMNQLLNDAFYEIFGFSIIKEIEKKSYFNKKNKYFMDYELNYFLEKNWNNLKKEIELHFITKEENNEPENT